MVCEENRRQIELQIPSCLQIGSDTLHGSAKFIGKYQYTRGDAQQHKEFGGLTGTLPCEGGGGDELEKSEEDHDSKLMIYSGQTVIPGAMFYHGFVLQNVSMLEYGALLHALDMWNESGANIGGSQRVGHGTLSTAILTDGVDDAWGQEESKLAYVKHVEGHGEECLDFLNEVFPK